MNKGDKMRYSRKDKKSTKNKKAFKEKISSFVTGAFIVFFIVTVAGLSMFTYNLLYKSNYFFIKESRIEWLAEPLSKIPYDKLRNTSARENIFRQDIKKITLDILADCPELKHVKVIRDFPDRLIIKIMPRCPIAQVGESSFFLIDEEGVVLTETRDTIEEGLPIITGAGWKLFRKIGQKENGAGALKALLLLKTMDDADFSDSYTLSKIDVSDYRNISFFMENGLEVKIGHANFKERLESLDKTLSTITVNRDEIRYIDLRFDDVVLGTK